MRTRRMKVSGCDAELIRRVSGRWRFWSRKTVNCRKLRCFAAECGILPMRGADWGDLAVIQGLRRQVFG